MSHFYTELLEQDRIWEGHAPAPRPVGRQEAIALLSKIIRDDRARHKQIYEAWENQLASVPACTFNTSIRSHDERFNQN